MNTTTCDQSREIVLHHDLDARQRQRVSAALQHVESCSQCQQALAQCDTIRQALTADAPDIEPAGGWEAFQYRVTDAARKGAHRPMPSRWYAKAAMLMLALGGVVVYVSRPSSVSNRPSVSAPAELTLADAADPVHAFQQISKVFDGKAQWLVLSDRNQDIGLTDTVLTNSDRPLMTRLAVVSGGKVISSADLVIIAGESAKAKIAMPQGRSIEYLIGTHAGAPSRVDLSADLTSGGQILAGLTTQLDVPSSRMISAGQISTPVGSYEIRVGLVQWRKPGSPL